MDPILKKTKFMIRPKVVNHPGTVILYLWPAQTVPTVLQLDTRYTECKLSIDS